MPRRRSDGALSVLNPLEGTLLPIWDFIFLENRVAVREEAIGHGACRCRSSRATGHMTGASTGRKTSTNVPIPLNGTWLVELDEPSWMPGWMQRALLVRPAPQHPGDHGDLRHAARRDLHRHGRCCIVHAVQDRLGARRCAM